jgi:hypothetical protein
MLNLDMKIKVQEVKGKEREMEYDVKCYGKETWNKRG